MDRNDLKKEQYQQLFHNFLLGGLHEMSQRLQASDAFTPEEAREHAWHLLTVALDSNLHPTPRPPDLVDQPSPATNPDIWTLARTLLLQLAPRMEQAGFREKWLPYLLRGSEVSSLYEDAQAEADCTLQIGLLYRLLSEFELARQWLQRALQHFLDRHDPAGEARACNQLGYVALHQHQLHEAEQWARRALTLLEEASLESATSLSLLGLVETARSQNQQAEGYHRRALQIRQTHGDLRTAAWSLQNLGYALSGQTLYDEARVCYESAIATLDDLQDFAHSAIARMNLGIVYYYHKDYQTALRLYAQAEEVFERVKNKHELARIYNNKGLCYSELSDWSTARRLFEECAQLSQTVGNWVERANTMDSLGLVYLKMDSPAKAIEIFNKALSELHFHTTEDVNSSLVKELTIHLHEAEAIQRNSGTSEMDHS